MAFCTACGSRVSDVDIFCAACGARQGTSAGATETGTAGFGGTATASGATATAGSAPGTNPINDFTAKVGDKNAALFCYIPIVGWLWAIVVLASNRFRHNREMRFHAFQGLYLFVAWLLVDWVISPMFFFGPHLGPPFAIGKLLHLAVLAAWIFMLVKTAQQQTYRLPIIGELAERSVAEQR